MTPELKEAWIKNLRSEKYKQQAQGTLYSKKEDAFCCLGVLCETAIEQGILIEKEVKWNQITLYEGQEALLSREMLNRLGLSYEVMKQLTRFNDLKHLSFAAIAEWLEVTDI